jgi:signal peptidase I
LLHATGHVERASALRAQPAPWRSANRPGCTAHARFPRRSIGRKIGVALLVLLGILLIPTPVMVRTFVAQPFNMPSGSMMPTLLIGDYFFVAKSAYGYTRFSLPFSPPVFSGRIFGAEPERGDLLVFRLPPDDTTDLREARGRVARRPGPDA